MEQSRPIPEEIKIWFIKQSHAPLTHRTYKEWARRGQELCYEVAYADGYQEASEAMYHRMAEELETLKGERDLYCQALENIADPIGYLRKEAEKLGVFLNGMAFEVIKSPEFFKQIAQPALEQYSSPKNNHDGV